MELLSHVKVQEKLVEDLEDAGNEIMLADEDVVKYTIGECFINIDALVLASQSEGALGT